MAAYYIAFDTKDMAPHIKATRIQIDTEVIRDMSRGLPINLSEHPLYPQLETYVKNNPSKRKG